MSAEKKIPRHVAIIMDGNGRWAKARGLERLQGHMQGVESIRRAIKGALVNGVEYLTVYAFSKENWARPREEVEGLMELLCRCAVNETPELKDQGVHISFVGDTESMRPEIRESIGYCERETADNRRLKLVIALNYSARWELVQMARRVAQESAQGGLSPEEITEETVSERLATAGIPDPDLIIRTSGEYRLSNFLLWQAAYSEFYFTDVQWPDFDETDFDQAIEDYGKRNRRFGQVR